jgi:hypothetical protein
MLREAMKGVIDHHAAYSIGTTYAWLKQPGEAVKWLQTAVDTGFQAYPWYERDPLLSPLHTNDAFRAFMRALRTTWQQNQRLAVSVPE